MMRTVSVVISILALVGCATDLIGRKVPPYPDGMFAQSGACITQHLGYERMCEYSIGLLQSNKNEFIGVLAKKSLRNTKDDLNNWVVTDQLPYPEIDKGFWLAFGECKVRGLLDGTVVAVVKDSDTEYQQANDWAWKVDLESGKFVKINPKDVICLNEGWGV